VKTERLTSIVFAASGIYDALLGLVFLLWPGRMYLQFSVTPPNHWAYVRFPAIILIVFGVMFFQVAFKPAENRNLIPYGILLKGAYAGTVFAYWFAKGLPDMWKPFAFCDTIFLLLFAWSWMKLAPPSKA
jgi:hypothetical protein